jgi:tRNA (guanine-N7-)-methyltransferase
MEPLSRTTDYFDLVKSRRIALAAWFSKELTGVSEVVWEVGCGHGHFLNAYAAAHPNTLCIGIDIEKDRITRADKKKKRAKLANLHFLRADASDFLDTLPEKVIFSAVYVLFPDPWPKRRHHKNRIMQPDFIEIVSRRIKPEGRLFFRTDHKPYYECTRKYMSSEKQLILTEDNWPFDKETVFQIRSKEYNSLNAKKIL